MSSEDVNLSTDFTEMSNVSFNTPVRQALANPDDSFWRITPGCSSLSGTDTPVPPNRNGQWHQPTFPGCSQSQVWTSSKSNSALSHMSTSACNNNTQSHSQASTSSAVRPTTSTNTTTETQQTKERTDPTTSQKFDYLDAAHPTVATLLKGKFQ